MEGVVGCGLMPLAGEIVCGGSKFSSVIVGCAGAEYDDGEERGDGTGDIFGDGMRDGSEDSGEDSEKDPGEDSETGTVGTEGTGTIGSATAAWVLLTLTSESIISTIIFSWKPFMRFEGWTDITIASRLGILFA